MTCRPKKKSLSNIGTRLPLELNLVSIKGEGPVGVAAIVETSIGRGQDAPASYAEGGAAAEHANVTLPRGGKPHYWYAYCNQKLKGTVTPSFGSGTIRKYHQTLNVSVGHPNSLTARQIVVRSGGGITYTFGGTFSGPNRKTPCK